MRKTTGKLFFSGMIGALLGGIIIVLILSLIGAGNRAVIEERSFGQDVIASAPINSPSTQSVTIAPSTVANPEENINQNIIKAFTAGEFGYSTPAGYRVAGKIVSMDEKNSVKGMSTLTLTKGTEQQESDYVNLVNQLQGGINVPPATELPQFLPGQTITAGVTTKNAEDSDAKLAKGQEKITTSQGISGRRYIRVEGSTPYDVVYLKLPNDRLVSVQMSYGSMEPLFDEVAFMAVVDSITILR